MTADAIPVAERLLERLTRSVADVTAGEADLTLLFSGGIDSALLAWLLRSSPAVELVTVGLHGSSDLARAALVAPTLGMRWRPIQPTPEEVASAWIAWPADLRRGTEPARSVTFALELAFASLAGRTVLIGQGADELFGGYARYADRTPNESVALAAADLARLRGEDGPRADRRAAVHGVRLRSPYLDAEFVAEVERLPAGTRFPVGERKGLLREVARRAAMPRSLTETPKKALQYGSGVARRVRELARTEREALAPPDRRG